MKFFVILILLVATAGLSFWNFFPRENLLPAAIQVFSKPAGAPVFINNESVGVTPYKNENLTSGEIKLAIGTGSASFAKIVKLNSKVFTIVNRELSDNLFFQAGEILNLEAGAGFVVASTPDGAEVEVDEKKVGITPLNLKEIIPGNHSVMVAKDGYIPRAIQVQTYKGYRLILDITLSATSENLAKTLGPSYAPQIVAVKVKISATPTGWLRVHENSSLGSLEIAKVSPGEELSLLEEKPGWFKIRLGDGREGWISSQFAKKL